MIPARNAGTPLVCGVDGFPYDGAPRGGEWRDRGPFAGASRAWCGLVAGGGTHRSDSGAWRCHPEMSIERIGGFTPASPSSHGSCVPEPRTLIGLHATPTTECVGPVYRARYYDPVRSRFVSEDPLGLMGSGPNLFAYVDSVGEPPSAEMNPYQYVGNAPTGYVDPLGLEKVVGGVIYDDSGRLIGEVGLQDPNPFLDPVNYLSGIGGGLLRNRILCPRFEGTGKSDVIIRWFGRYKTRLDISNPAPHSRWHIHWWTKN